VQLNLIGSLLLSKDVGGQTAWHWLYGVVTERFWRNNGVGEVKCTLTSKMTYC